MQITRLRLLGFKSFVEPTELVIEKGLTGVVGPNGCGKSNLLEALRWVMGETSYKSMRASTMEDVIFSGTNARPSRNMAEVTISIDNAARTAPAELNDADVLEVTRRIERDAGSAYRVNGGEVRARDIKLLFEDAATGARSPSLVRQGQIAEIVNAKPEQRRRILEDAAGIAGLHSRRHEAELRLKAAEGNLARVNDVLGQLTSQIEALKRQTRQARRYREISGEIRKAEALLLHLSWTAAQAEVVATEAALWQGLGALAAATEREAALVTEEAERAAAIDPLREDEARRGAALARIRIEQENFEKEARRLAERQRELEERAEQMRRDIEREQQQLAEVRAILERLATEAETINGEAEGGRRAEEETRARLDEAEAKLGEAQARLTEVTARAIEARTRRRALESAHAERLGQVKRIESQLASLATQAREIAARAPDAERLQQLTEAGQRLMREAAAIEDEALVAEERAAELAIEGRTREQEAQAAQLTSGQLRTEVETLAKLLLPVRDDGLPPMIDELRVAPGYERALGAALGDDLDAPIAEEADMYWRRVGRVADGVHPLALEVDAPPELARRLAQIGVVAREDGRLLQPYLRTGQRLVSPEGDLWRWDGFTVAATAPTAAAVRLAERNRLSELEVLEDAARREAEDLASAARTAREVHRMAESEERRLRQAGRETQAELARTREKLTVIERQARETEQRLAAVAENRTAAEAALIEAKERLAESEAAIAALDNDDALEAEVATAERETSAHRGTAGEIRQILSRLERDAHVRAERLNAIGVERTRWEARCEDAGSHVATLSARMGETESELADMSELPAELEAQRVRLHDQMQAAEAERSAAADRLAQAQSAHRESQQALKAAQAAVSDERESRARVEAKLEAARQKRSEEARRIRETMECAPEACLALAEVAPDAALPSMAGVDRSLQRLKADRERLGGVNLAADDELQKMNEQFAAMDLERLDVEQAINKLRGAIGQLNREAKKRLGEAFDQVNGHFQRLFGTLFGGGEARLEMIESEEDPLEGGLEIIARPPGKKPATLSLLSGGEQTLTALSLIFAVFLTNPSPICVLDEVDAPLDDANVDRFCSMMERMASETETRFLVITHHPMTMARMDRLFGVTMAERGVSQLVSVDLATAERIIENGHEGAQAGAA
ncbi:MAG: chromosome segregation protein SMC [Hyphomicrobium sp. SCN 65-11]|nr:MAG: chromosome segregation protein SMC [Hyphomicrobium sp. SCN 65-11]